MSCRAVPSIRQDLFRVFIYNLIGIPIAAGILQPVTGFLLDDRWCSYGIKSVSVVSNSVRPASPNQG
jgi:Cu2+-exporting ATPase